MYEIEYSNSFKKDYKLIKKRRYDLSELHKVFKQLMEKGNVDAEYLPHKLTGNYTGYWECHIQGDWLLVWKIDKDLKLVKLIATGTHSDLF
ncbi:MAG: type II toxin-antitoxin system YafQ family toxin [Chitinophagaceae bacterium]|jgi:mRNA interferase YafQ|nr:type II toxin-antitoxin system YafQ family toxin [Chitinophagaceae bacterium]